MKITVNKDNVKIEEFDVVHEGEHRVNKCSFSFSEEYTEDLVKKAIFTSQNSSVEVAIINNECNIPTEILKARNIVLLGVYAYKVTEDKLDLRYSPSPDAFKVNSGSYIEGTSESEEITPSQFEQYMQALNDGLNKVEESLKKMDSATSSATQLVDNINQKLENGDFIGPEGPQGVTGPNGKDGVGITTITSGQSSVEGGKTITPITVNKTDGSSESFNVEAKNGQDGQNGKDGKDGVNGQDGTTPNIQIGTVETLEPNEHATVTRTGTDEEPVFNFGIPKGQQGGKGLDGTNGTDGKDATINGQNTVEITTDNNITLEQQENILKFGLDSQLIPKNNAEGTDNTFDDGLKSPLFALSGDGKSEQKTTTGKNLFDYTTVRSTSGLTTTINTDGSITTKGTPTESYIKLVLEKDYNDKLDDGETYTISQDIAGYIYLQIYAAPKDGGSTIYYASSNSQTRKETSFTVDKSIYDYKATLQSGLLADVGENINFTAKFQLEKGSKATSYEPYTGGQPSPSSDYKQPINSIEGSVEFACRGKNIFTKKSSTQTSNGITTVFKDNTFTYNGIASLNYSNCVPTGNFKITKGTYTFSITNPLDTSFNVRFQKTMSYNDGSFEARINKGETSVTFTLPDDFDFFYFYLLTKEGNTYSGHASIQMEKGTTATEYEPYIEPNKVTFNLNDEKLRSVGDVKDELVVDLDTGDYYKVENVGEYIFDGSDDENWVTTDAYEGYYRYICKISNDTYNPTIGIEAMNNYFTQRINQAQGDYEYLYLQGSNVGLNTYIQIKNYSDVDQFKQWLSTHNTIVDYILQTPTTKKLGTLPAEDLAKLKTFKGYNNVTVNTNLGLMNIRFTYGLDIKKYVDNKIAEISAQLIKGE